MTYQFEDIQQRLLDDLMQVPDEGLIQLHACATLSFASKLSEKLRTWLCGTIEAERARREFKSSAPVKLELVEWAPQELATALPLSLSLHQATVDPLTEQFALTLHSWIIAHACAALCLGQ